MSKTTFALSVTAVAGLLLAGCSTTKEVITPVPTAAAPSTVVVAPTPPPAPRHETQPPSPGHDFVWHSGYWAWADGQYQWIPGHWEPTPVGGTG